MDNGVSRRLNVAQFDSEFKKDVEDDYVKRIFKKDTAFKDKLETTYKFALIWVLAQKAQQFEREQDLPPLPAEWNDETKKTIATNDDFGEWLKDNFDIGPTFKCVKADVEDRLADYKAKKMNMTEFKDMLKKMRIEYNYNPNNQIKNMTKTATKRGVFTGFKVKDDSVDELDELG